MNFKKSVAVKLIVEITTQELFDRVSKSRITNPEQLDDISFSLITGYEKSIRRLFREGLLYIALGDELREAVIGIDVFEIHVTNHRDKTFSIKHTDIQDVNHNGHSNEESARD